VRQPLQPTAEYLWSPAAVISGSLWQMVSAATFARSLNCDLVRNDDKWLALIDRALAQLR